MFCRLAITVASTAIVAGCVAVSPPPATVPHRLTQAEIASTQKGVRSSLKDPYSAMFGPSAAAAQADNRNIIYVCGSVNAKNSFGGYTGQKLYFGILGKFDGIPGGIFRVISMEDGSTGQMCDRYVLRN